MIKCTYKFGPLPEGPLVTTQFASIAEAIDFAVHLTGADPATREPLPDLQIISFIDSMVLNLPTTTEEKRAAILAKGNVQKAFKFKKTDGQEVHIVISPFRNGYDCSIVTANGMSARV